MPLPWGSCLYYFGTYGLYQSKEVYGNNLSKQSANLVSLKAFAIQFWE